MRHAAALITVSISLIAAGCGGGSTTPSATCTDGVMNGTETAIDCGGDECEKCAASQGCAVAGDCLSGICGDDGLCACEDGYEASNGTCVNVDDCDPNPCENGGTCADGVNSFTCTCETGFSGPTCATADPCTPNPCKNGATCTAGLDGAECACPAGYWGGDCANTCNTPAHCEGDVSCAQADGTNPVCSACQAGWKGTACADDVNECDEGLDDCAETARCVNTIGSFTCGCPVGSVGDGTVCETCEAGKWGVDCEQVCVGGHCSGAPTCDPVDGSNPACEGCSDGYTGPDCSATCDAGNCKNGAVRCDQSDATARECYQGCTDGWYGTACDTACETDKCKLAEGAVVACDQTTGVPSTCPACQPGFTGPSCQADCTQGNCLGTVTCAQANPDQGRLCTEGCVDGWRGETCEGACPPHAHCLGTSACDQTTGTTLSCASCEGGYWGATCGTTCATPQHCTGAVTCQKDTGIAISCGECLPGYFGTSCDQNCEIAHCIGTPICVKASGAAVSCDTCQAGYWGNTCASECPLISHCAGEATCDKTTGEGASCTQCSAGYWGPTCQETCSIAGCAGAVTCDQTTGQPVSCSVCEPGKWGPTCTNNCTRGNCTGEVTCDQVTGVRQTCEGCEDGYWGATCTSACQTGHCAGAVGTCDKDSGVPTGCPGGCVDGYWGATCQSACAQGYCSGTVTCAQVGGAAISCGACVAGHWGPTCASACDKGNCVGSPTCDKTTGTAISCPGCAVGYWGTTCGSSCTHTGCEGAIVCNQTSGDATGCAACTAGRWGTTCDNSCTQGNCTGTVSCSKSSGLTTSCTGCQTGYWGGTCAIACEQGNCASAMTCAQDTGLATACPACDAGFWGTTCDAACDAGHCAGDYTCAKTTGTPLTCSACDAGWLGALCDSYAVQSCVEYLDNGQTTSGKYTIDPDGAAGDLTAIEVWCDMNTHDGGFSFFKVQMGTAVNAAQAEQICADYGMQLFIPRSAQHLASAFAVATSGGYGPDGSAEYLRIMGIYPNAAGAACANQPFNSGNTGCNWAASDGGAYWVSNRTDIGQPNGNNNLDGSMSYSFNVDGAVTAYDDVAGVGYTSDRFICDLGDRTFIGHSCQDWYDAGFHISGTYTIDPDGPGGAIAPYQTYCDQVTNGGGWTRMVAWDRAAGSTLAQLAQQMTLLTNQMGEFTDRSGYSEWSDWDSSADVLAYQKVVPFPNAGEVRVDIHYQGISMDDSATFVFGIVNGAPVDIVCGDDITPLGNLSAYTAAEQAYFPSYSCPNAGISPDNWTWNGVYQKDLGTSVSALRFHSLHWDGGGGDSSWLYRLNMWVR
ncbi:MAG: hypothetical protein EP329_10460 [Deltaproteobacteria bacterium]|nr:MAG: hypothetical protein EP329_10460 [Deltaproteobacteria bacterium]